MNAGPRGRIVLGVLTAAAVIVPLVIACVVVLMVMFVMASVFAVGNSSEPPPLFFMPFGLFSVVFPVIFLFSFLSLGLQAYYFAHLIGNHVAPDAIKMLLGLGLLFMPIITMPIYYYLYVWRALPPAWAAVPGLEQPLSP